MSDMCDVPDCTRPAYEEALGHLCVTHADACDRERALVGSSWTQAFIDAGPDANEDDVVANWYSRWCAEQRR